MKTIFLVLCALVLPLLAEPEAKSFMASDNTEVLYRIAAPAKIENGKKYPLVIFLHGSGSRGNDNKLQLRSGVSAILKNTEKIGEPTFLIAPQCPAEIWWTDVDDTAKRTEGQKPITLLDAVFELIEDTTKTHAIDPKRIYITGLSMGGFGTWAALAKKPDLFAAAIPICGGGDPKTAASFKHVPIQIFHGDADTVVKPERSQKMFDALKQAGSDAKLTLYPGVGHDSWTQTYDNQEIIRWLFSQKKSN